MHSSLRACSSTPKAMRDHPLLFLITALAIVLIVVIFVIRHVRDDQQRRSKRYLHHRLHLEVLSTKVLELTRPHRLPHTTLPLAAYNPSTLRLSTGTVLHSYKLSAFTRCPASTSELYYRSSPHDLASAIVLQWTARDGTHREVMLNVPPPDTQSCTVNGKPLLSYVPAYEDARLVEYRRHIVALVNARTEASLGATRMHLIHICHVDRLDSLTDQHPCRVVQLQAPRIPDVQLESRDEKNWTPLVYTPPERSDDLELLQGSKPRVLEQLYLVYSISPTVVLALPELDLDGTGPLRHGPAVCGRLTSHNPILDPNSLLSLPDGNDRILRHLRGGTQLLKGQYMGYTGLAHYRSAGHYYTVPYLLADHPPFTLLEVGQPIKLQGALVEYASGLRWDKDDLVVTYGVDDCTAVEARIALHTDPTPRPLSRTA